MKVRARCRTCGIQSRQFSTRFEASAWGHNHLTNGQCECVEYKDIDPDSVNHPAHYTNHPSGVEPIVITETMGFCLGNVIKYVMRADLKGNPIEDLRKAAFYLDREIARREKAGDE